MVTNHSAYSCAMIQIGTKKEVNRICSGMTVFKYITGSEYMFLDTGRIHVVYLP